MSVPVVVLDDPASLPVHGVELRVCSTADFLRGGDVAVAGARVINLAAACGYLEAGWYVSLLAEARGGRPLPEAALLEQSRDRRSKERALREQGVDVLDAEEVAARSRLAAQRSPEVLGTGLTVPLVIDDPDEPQPRAPGAHELAAVRIVAGSPLGGRAHAATAQRCFAAWPLPLMEALLVREAGRWRVFSLQPLRLAELDAGERAELPALLARTGTRPTPEAAPTMPSLAVLWDGSDPGTASSAETLDRLARVAADHGLRVERLHPSDLHLLSDHDALFIRTVTGVDQPAWAWATRAEALGMPVIDHPDAIVRCGNKVYLHELLQRAGIATPPTRVFGQESSFADLTAALGAPVVVKVPDGSFSTAVFCIASAEDFAARVPPLLERSPLLVAQAFLPTAYDWRVGVLDGRVVWVARYHMVPGHWQIRDAKGGQVRFGRVEAVARAQAPKAVLQIAVAAARRIGRGLLGVDIKDTDTGPVIIEVNDNPNLDTGYEDGIEGDQIYAALVRWFLRELRPADGAPGAPASRAPGLVGLRAPIGRVPAPRSTPYGAYQVVGLELEYPIVDRDLNVMPVAESVLASLGGRPCSDVALGRFGVSNELVDHVLEVKNIVPHSSLARAEAELVEGVRRLGVLLDQEHRARLLPGGMHPWLDPRGARVWKRSNRRIYETYARLFDLKTHGWANVHAVHVNLPLGTADEAAAMMNAARLLVPYLPALAASSPLVEGELTGRVDNRVAWLLEHQARLPESMGRLVPEPLGRLADYKREVLAPMYAAVDRIPGADALRAEFLNARGAVIKASRNSMEVRILDVQECVRADVAVAWFVRRALRWLARHLDDLPAAPQWMLEDDLLAVSRHGGAARVHAPFASGVSRDAAGLTSGREVLAWVLERIAGRVAADERVYAELCAGIVARGSLSEAILRKLGPLADAADAADDPSAGRAFTEAARTIWIQLADCLLENRPWSGRDD